MLGGKLYPVPRLSYNLGIVGGKVFDWAALAAWRPLMSKTCQSCGAKCCKYFCFEIDEPDSYEEFEDIRWYLCHEGVTVHIDEGDWFINIDNRCSKLGPDNLCTIYENRPLICRKYDPAECDFTGGDYGFEAHFTSPEELEAYARKALGEKEFRRARKRQRAKLQPAPAGKTKKKKNKTSRKAQQAAG